MTHSRTVLALLMGLSTLMFVTCANRRTQQLDAEFGKPEPVDIQEKSSSEPVLDYRTEIAPILERRCVVCHGCYDAPCQLKLGALEGLLRGASKDKVYDPSRIVAQPPTRLFEDASSTEEWRKMGFFPVLNERKDTPLANRSGSVLHQLLEQKRAHPLPNVQRLDGFDFSLDRKQECPTLKELPQFQKDHPLWGMPYGLPALSDEEFETISQWIKAGGKTSLPEKPSDDLSQAIDEWEQFFNPSTLQGRLVSRYVYEHWFLGHFYFSEVDGDDSPTYFELVRSKTPPGRPLDRISTRRPLGDPGVDRVYYRFTPLRTPLLVKNHIPLALTPSKMQRLRELFYEPDYPVTELPGYQRRHATNPFDTFRALPISSRYRFMLDDARFIMNGFIKGPVCRGQTSVNVIDDRFWVVFLNPDLIGEEDARFYESEVHDLDLPAKESSDADILVNWLAFSKKEHRYLERKAKHLARRYQGKEISPQLIWDGGSRNPDAALTVFRHVDSATVLHGLVGSPPKTAWVLDYGIFERIHYLLVAGFDVFGNVGHQLNTRIYMDFLRMEAEANFLAFLPPKARAPISARWYRGAEKEMRPFIHGPDTTFFHQAKELRQSMNPELVLYEKLQTHLRPVTTPVEAARERLLPSALAPLVAKAESHLSQLQGGGVTLLPPVSFVRVEGDDETYFFSILRDDAHTNLLTLFDEEDRRVPEEDRLTIVSGLVGAYPNALFRVPAGKLHAFALDLSQLDSDSDLDAFRDEYGVRRTDPTFWQESDLLHDYSNSTQGTEAGLLDFNRLVNF